MTYGGAGSKGSSVPGPSPGGLPKLAFSNDPDSDSGQGGAADPERLLASINAASSVSMGGGGGGSSRSRISISCSHVT